MANIYKNHPRNEKHQRKLRVLVAPLDWGLGHATRCIPLIHELIRQDAEPWLAGEGAVESLLRAEFPAVPFLSLPGYRVRYGRTPLGLFRKLLFQAPRIIKTIKNEHKWLNEMQELHGFDGIISDNRFGLWHAEIPSVFITHQLNIRTPLGKWAAGFIQSRNYRYINRFTQCWVPDKAAELNWAGELSHPRKLPAIPTQYIGLLSRLSAQEVPVRKHHLFIALSGPEPQRTLFENKIIQQVSHYGGTATILRGLPSSNTIIPSSNDIRFYNHLSAEDFAKEMSSAEFVISRSGYSTVMDIIRMGKNAILIPTPGQSEQEYLAEYLEEKGWVCAGNQRDFHLSGLLEKARKFEFRSYERNDQDDKLRKTVSDFLEML